MDGMVWRVHKLIATDGTEGYVIFRDVTTRILLY